MLNKTTASNHKSTNPNPLSITPRIIVLKYLNGITYETDCIIFGIFSIGNANPDKNIIGIITAKIAIIIACCCVLEIVEMNNPMPRVDSM